MIIFDGIDFTWAQRSPNRSEHEELIHDSMNLTGNKIGLIRADGAGEFVRSVNLRPVARSISSKVASIHAYIQCTSAIRVCKDKVHALLRRANMLRRFGQDILLLLHWCRTYDLGLKLVAAQSGRISTTWSL